MGGSSWKEEENVSDLSDDLVSLLSMSDEVGRPPLRRRFLPRSHSISKGDPGSFSRNKPSSSVSRDSGTSEQVDSASNSAEYSTQSTEESDLSTSKFQGSSFANLDHLLMQSKLPPMKQSLEATKKKHYFSRHFFSNGKSDFSGYGKSRPPLRNPLYSSSKDSGPSMLHDSIQESSSSSSHHQRRLKGRRFKKPHHSSESEEDLQDTNPYSAEDSINDKGPL